MEISDNEILEICMNSSSMLQASKKLNISLSTLSKRAKVLGCYITNQNWNKGKNIFTDTRCSKNSLSDIFCENSNSSIKSLRLPILEYFGNFCSCCGISKWMDGPISLEIDHINGINNDNRLENLRILCPNCHSQTDTFRGRNIKKLKKNDDGLFAYSKEDLIKSVESSFSIREVCLKLGIVPKGGNYKTIRNKIDEYSLLLKPKVKKKRARKNIAKKTSICECGSEMDYRSISCKKCVDKKSQRKSERPRYEDLLNEVQKIGYSAVGRKYNVSDNAIRKWIRFYENSKSN